MNKAEAYERFARANAMYRAGQYAEALVELDVLILHHPENPGVVEARARTLEHLGRDEEALALYDTLIDDLEYDKARPRRNRVLERLGRPHAQATGDAEPEEAYGVEEVTLGSTRKKSRIKPVRLLILVAILAGMYFDYVPYWLGGGLVVGYFLVKYLLKVAFNRLFTIPFRMKGKALAGATTQLHGFQWTTAPPYTEDHDDEEAKAKGPLRYVWLDVTITPPVRTQGFTHWEPGELVLAPMSLKFRSPDDHDKCFSIHEVRFVKDGKGVLDGEDEEDEGCKVAGPQRIKVLAGVPLDQNRFKFAYYFESFGDIALP